MTRPLSSKMAPFMVGMFSAWMFAGCGGQDAVQGEREGAPEGQPEVVQTTVAQLNQQDVDTFTNAVKLRNCTFVVAAGAAAFTPSNELSQLFYGDPNGNAHKFGFPVPAISGGGVTMALTNLNTQMANTGLTLAGSTATVKLSFDGMLRISLSLPVIGRVSPDIQINSSSISVALVYDSLTQRAQVTRVSSQLDLKAKNCGTFGWCNGLVDQLLHSKLETVLEVPLRDAFTKGLDSADVTTRIDNLLVSWYNFKDPQAMPWTMVANTLKLAAGAFTFTAQRKGP